MHFAPTIRTNPETGQGEPYFRLKETYRDAVGVVRSRTLLSPGFIQDYASKDLSLVAKVLTFMMDNRGKGWLWEDALKDYPEHVAELLNLDLSSFNKHNIYAVAPSLYAIKDKLETFLCQKTDSLFDLTNRIVLFDLTIFYYEGRKEQSR